MKSGYKRLEIKSIGYPYIEIILKSSGKTREQKFLVCMGVTRGGDGGDGPPHFFERGRRTIICPPHFLGPSST